MDPTIANRTPVEQKTLVRQNLLTENPSEERKIPPQATPAVSWGMIPTKRES